MAWDVTSGWAPSGGGGGGSGTYLEADGSVPVQGTLVPDAAGTRALGSNALPFGSMRATQMISGDLVFDDTHCLICSQRFRPGETILLQSIAVEPDENPTKAAKGGTLTRTVPVHAKCAARGA